MLAATGVISEAGTQFEPQNNLRFGGVLFAFPGLNSQGLLKATRIFEPLSKGFYGLTHIILLVAYMALLRIKNPEQLKTISVGELGKVMGLDRVPEVRCLREKLSQIANQNKGDAFMDEVRKEWILSEECVFFYIDGHVRVYHGDEANLSRKFVSRQKLCLPGTTDFWVNNSLGLPFMVVTGELTEKLKDAILLIIPALIKDTAELVTDQMLEADPNLPRFTLIFDREAYEPAFFIQLWNDYRIAVITYRKNVKDLWDEKSFEWIETEVIKNNVRMQIYEQKVEISGHSFREVRKLSENGHQTSMITTHPTLAKEVLAGKMFSRWSQENYFRYMSQDFGLDNLIEYGTESIDPNREVVNPDYHKLSHKIKKLREKKSRVQAKLLEKLKAHTDQTIDTIGEILNSSMKLQQEMEQLEKQISELLKDRAEFPSRIKVGEMDPSRKYNKLKKEKQLFINVIKMIAYRAETALVNLVAPYYSRNEEEGRMLIKSIFSADADIIPDYTNKTLTVILHSMANPRRNKAVEQLCEILNESESIYPGTNLVLKYKTLANQFTMGQEF